MQLCKLQSAAGPPRLGFIADGQVHLLHTDRARGISRLSDILYAHDVKSTIEDLIDERLTSFPLKTGELLAPIDRQEIWAAGVTYKRSKVAREHESQSAGSFYDKVYAAKRPELFFKSTAERVVGPNGRVRVRRDSKWSVPEPELALFVAPDRRIVGYSIGNDMSARDIEGENPLYLPQAKVYDQSCALGPAVTLAHAFPPRDQVAIEMTIERGGKTVFQGSTRLTEMARTAEELVEWLFRENTFPHGVVLLTGTGIVPPDDFALAAGDRVAIEISAIGRLLNMVA
jgi:2-dehydro-3-deoxy-D-arabinonate dehydratase